MSEKTFGGIELEDGVK